MNLQKSIQFFLKLNLEKEADKHLFERYNKVNELLITIYCAMEKVENQPTLLFIDEIQNSPKAVAILRYFYDKANHIHVIAVGSLLNSLLNTQHISSPVGKVEYMDMRACSFLEFLNRISPEKHKEL